MFINQIPNFNYHNTFGKRKYEAPKTKIGTAEEIGLKLGDVLKSRYARDVRLGEKINSGMNADVHSLAGWENSYIVRLERKEDIPAKFEPQKLIPTYKGENSVLFESEDKNVSIRKRIAGEPMHGTHWRTDKSADINTFWKTMKTLSELPDSAYEKYIDEVIKIRKNGFDIDRFNPNNYLIDKAKNKINIIDLSKNHWERKGIEIKDFFPFIDSKRLNGLFYAISKDERETLADTVKSFLDRMIKIAKKKRIFLEVERPAVNPLEQFYQNYAILLYHKAEILFKKKI